VTDEEIRTLIAEAETAGVIEKGVSGCENPRKDGEELDRGAKHRRCSSWVRVI
jgi:hypothetical protein